MEHLDSIFIVFAILLVVLIAAMSFEPANPFGPWLELARRYGTDRLPSQFVFADEHILFGGARGPLKGLAQYAAFDAMLDDDGLWLRFKGAVPEDCPSTLRVPGTHVRFLQQKGEQYRFELFAEPPVKMAVYGEFGKGIKRRCQIEE